MGVFVIGGIEISECFFGGNVWADIMARLLLIAGMGYLIPCAFHIPPNIPTIPRSALCGRILQLPYYGGAHHGGYAFQGMGYLIHRFLRSSIKEFGVYVESELDRFSIAVLIVSLCFGIVFVLRPMDEEEMRAKLSIPPITKTPIR